jgi:hypothetical protein
MKFWIDKASSIKVWQQNFTIQTNGQSKFDYYAPSNGIEIAIKRDDKCLAEFDLNGRVKVAGWGNAKFETLVSFNSRIRQRIFVNGKNIDLIVVESPAKEIHLGTKLKNWKKAISNTVKYEVFVETDKVADILHFAGMNPKEKKRLEISIDGDDWVPFILVHCVNFLEDLKQVGGATG